MCLAVTQPPLPLESLPVQPSVPVARSATNSIVVIPVVRIAYGAYFLPGCAAVDRRLQYCAVVFELDVPPNFHFYNWSITVLKSKQGA